MIADLAGVGETQAAETLATIEAQPTVTRELLMRRFVEAWLEGQRRALGFIRNPSKTPDHEDNCR